MSVIPKVTKHLLSNPVFTCVILAACMEIGVVAGFAAFLGKYLEQQFNLSTSSANQLLGRQVHKNIQVIQVKSSKHPQFQIKSLQVTESCLSIFFFACVYRYDSNPLCLSGHFPGRPPGEKVGSVCIRGHSSGHASQYHLYGLLRLLPFPWL